MEGENENKRNHMQQDETEKIICKSLPNVYAKKFGPFLCPLLPDSTLGLPSAKNLKNSQKSKASSSESPNLKKFESLLQQGVLNIPNLELGSVPQSIFTISPSIRVIYLRSNHLTQLPSQFFDQLPSLAFCDLRDNELRNLGEISQNHSALRTLLLENNELNRLPYSLARATNLCHLTLNGNEIVDPPPNVLILGSSGILSYLKYRLQYGTELDSDSDSDLNLSYSENEEDNSSNIVNLPQVKHRTTVKRGKNSYKNGKNGKKLSCGDAVAVLGPKNRLIRNLLYSDGLWAHVQQNGVTNQQLIQKAKEDLQNEVSRKIADRKEGILQKMRDRQALSEFRTQTSQLQRVKKQTPNLIPPFGVEGENRDKNEVKGRKLSLNEFETEFKKSWDRLSTLTNFNNPTPTNNIKNGNNLLEFSSSEDVLGKIRELEGLHKNLCELKLSLHPTPL